MKLKFSIIFILLLLPIISAVDVDVKSNFSQGETFIAKVSGNFFETISQNNLVFKRDHTKVPVLPFVKKINDDFYIYAQLFGKQSGNYSLTIENLKYYQVNEIIEEDKVINFVITENSADFLIEPGFVSTKNDFSIELQNIKNEEVTVFYKIGNSPSEAGGFFDSLFGGGGTIDESLTPIILKSGEKKSINFEISDFNKGLNNLEFNTENTLYQIPVFILGKGESEKIIPNSGLNFELSVLNLSLSTDSDTTRIIYLWNNGESTIENISLYFSDELKQYISLSKNETFDLEKNSSEKIEIIFTSDDEAKVLEGQIQAISGDLFSNIAVILNFLPGFVPAIEGKVPSCSELSGNLCVEGQTCDGDLASASDGNCCVGTCKEEVKRSSAGKIVGWILLASIVGYLIWFYFKKFKKVERVSDLLKLANKKK